MSAEEMAAMEARIMSAMAKVLADTRDLLPREALPKLLLTPEEVAIVLRCGVERARELIASGTLRTKSVGKAKELVPVAEVMRLADVEDPQGVPARLPEAVPYLEAAKRLSVSLSTLKRMVLEGHIRAAKVGQKPRIPVAEIERVLGTSFVVQRRSTRRALRKPFDWEAEAQALNESLRQIDTKSGKNQ